MTLDELIRATAARAPHALRVLPHMEAALKKYDITSAARKAAFLAQVSHESGRLRYLSELWGPTPAQLRYEARADLGNTAPGDGYRYRGRGLIQITGRSNYRACGAALGVDLEANPDLLQSPEHAVHSAAWFWYSRGLNAIADSGDFRLLTRRINGGLNGYDERMAMWALAKTVFA